MAYPYSLKEGEELVRAARHSIELHLSSPRFNKGIIERQLAHFTDHHGLFVTIEHYPTRTMRGRMGVPSSKVPIHSLLPDVAVAAATNDKRYVPVSHMEFEDITVGVDIISKPEALKGRSAFLRKKEIEIGRDGLMIEYGFHSGAVLPIEPVEKGWNKQQLFEHLCMEAALPEGTWQKPNANLFRFSAQMFRELSPRGPIEEVVFK